MPVIVNSYIENKKSAISTYLKVAVHWLNKALCFNKYLCSVDFEASRLRNPRLRQAANRSFEYNLSNSQTVPSNQHLTNPPRPPKNENVKQNENE